MDTKDPNLLAEVFNQRAAILTFFGALGGSVRAAVLKTTWREGLRVVFVGGAVSFGVGVLAPIVMKPWIGEIPDGMAGALGTLTAASFLIGLVAVTLVERFVSGDSIGPKDKRSSPHTPTDYAPPPRRKKKNDDHVEDGQGGPDYGGS